METGHIKPSLFKEKPMECWRLNGQDNKGSIAVRMENEEDISILTA